MPFPSEAKIIALGPARLPRNHGRMQRPLDIRSVGLLGYPVAAAWILTHFAIRPVRLVGAVWIGLEGSFGYKAQSGAKHADDRSFVRQMECICKLCGHRHISRYPGFSRAWYDIPRSAGVYGLWLFRDGARPMGCYSQGELKPHTGPDMGGPSRFSRRRSPFRSSRS